MKSSPASSRSSTNRGAPGENQGVSKPPYLIPSLEEIKGSRKTGLKAVSTFSGCGGTCLGLRWAGFRVVWASEFIPAARETYLANFPDVYVDDRDIRKVQGKEILDQVGLKTGELDLLEGSPPCAAFSTVGKRARGWGNERKYSETRQRVDDLIFEFARLVRETNPRAFSMENVAGLAHGVGSGMLRQLLREFRSMGYTVGARLLDAQWLGVPQKRLRLFVIGMKNGKAPSFPRPFTYRYNVREALAGCAPASPDDKSRTSVTPGAWNETAVGKEWGKLVPGRMSRRYYSLLRASWDEPLPTLTTLSRGAAVMHPSECRRFTIEEAKRLCGFPDDFTLTGTYAQQLERLGRAVPPPLGRAVATEIARVLTNRG